MRAGDAAVRRWAIVDRSPSARAAAELLIRRREWRVSCALPTNLLDSRPLNDGLALPVRATLLLMPVRLVPCIRARPAALRLVYCRVEEIEGALMLGADDLLVEPWTTEELLARVHRAAALRRERLVREDAHRLLRRSGNRSLRASRVQQRMFELLLLNLGRVVDRATLHAHLSSAAHDESVSRAVDMAVCRLRPAAASLGVSIETVRGVGYRAVPARGDAERADDVDNVWNN